MKFLKLIMAYEKISFMKAENYLDKKAIKPCYNVIGYYMTEKFDGCRAQWHPKTKRFISRLGNDILAPLWFLDYFKNIEIPLDGEIFFGYGNWGLTGICRSNSQIVDKQNLWKKAVYLVFDIPDIKLGKYSERMEILDSHIGKWGDASIPIWTIPRHIVKSNDDITVFYNNIVKRGGEGVIFNNPTALYVDGRSDNILKYKPIHDNEAIIVGYKQGSGKYAHTIGSFIVHPIEEGLPDPLKEFSISGMTDIVRANYKDTHPIGTIITYSYNELTKTGKPRFPRYLGKCQKPVLKETEKQTLCIEPELKVKPRIKILKIKCKLRQPLCN